jgi:GT2 family glycosyltransferase
MTEPLVSVQVVVRNGERFIRACLDAVHAQTYRNCEIVVLDNASTDDTAHIIAAEYPDARLIRSDRNRGMWPGHEFLMAHTRGSYVLAVSVDVIIDPAFIACAVAACEQDPAIGAVQGKVLQLPDRNRVDTCGFSLTRGRKVLNIGHGQFDGPAFSRSRIVLGVEGAVPFFRRSALEDCNIEGHIWDPDYFWYGDDLDLAWRMTLLGHRQIYLPDAVAWHDRSTTKGFARVPIVGQLGRIRARRAIPLFKRRLDWSNTRFTIIKNDSIINILRDLPWILPRELLVLGYTALFEPGVFKEFGRFFRLLPRMLRRRTALMRRIHP